MKEEAASNVPLSRRNVTIDDGSPKSSSSAIVSSRQLNGRKERTLHDVAKLGKLSSVQAFVVKQVDNNEFDRYGVMDINEFDRYGVTPIFYAVVKGHLEVVRYLANHGAGKRSYICYFFHL